MQQSVRQKLSEREHSTEKTHQRTLISFQRNSPWAHSSQPSFHMRIHHQQDTIYWSTNVFHSNNQTQKVSNNFQKSNTFVSGNDTKYTHTHTHSRTNETSILLYQIGNFYVFHSIVFQMYLYFYLLFSALHTFAAF